VPSSLVAGLKANRAAVETIAGIMQLGAPVFGPAAFAVSTAGITLTALANDCDLVCTFEAQCRVSSLGMTVLAGAATLATAGFVIGAIPTGGVDLPFVAICGGVAASAAALAVVYNDLGNGHTPSSADISGALAALSALAALIPGVGPVVSGLGLGLAGAAAAIKVQPVALNAPQSCGGTVATTTTPSQGTISENNAMVNIVKGVLSRAIDNGQQPAPIGAAAIASATTSARARIVMDKPMFTSKATLGVPTNYVVLKANAFYSDWQHAGQPVTFWVLVALLRHRFPTHECDLAVAMFPRKPATPPNVGNLRGHIPKYTGRPPVPPGKTTTTSSSSTGTATKLAVAAAAAFALGKAAGVI
jgi:hypothetical protein